MKRRFAIEVLFEGKQSELEAEDCRHQYRGDMIFVRGDRLYIAEEHSVYEVDLNKPIKNLKILLVERE